MTIWYLLSILVFGLGLFWWISREARRRRRVTESDRAMITSKWQDIERLLAQDRAREAIFEADKLLDFVFQKINLHGETFADRLRGAEQLLPNYQDVWTAHKVRNKFAHELDFQILPREAKKIIDIFDQAIRKLVKY